MHTTKKAKLEQFDALLAERDLLRLAVHDLVVPCKFTPKHAVKVDCGKEIDGQYTIVYRVSMSDRAMPYYMIEEFGLDGKVFGVTFITESELDSERQNPYIFWRAIRHAAWKIQQKRLAA